MRRQLGWILVACGSMAAACSSNNTPATTAEPSAPATKAAATPVVAERTVTAAPSKDEERPSRLHYRQRPRGLQRATLADRARPDGPPPPAPQPLLTYRSGPMLQGVDIHAVYWGANVTPPTGADISSYFTTISTNGPFFQMLSEYNVSLPSPLTIGAGTFAGAYVDIDAPLPASGIISDEMVQAEVSRLLDQGKVTNSANSLYFFFFPQGYAVDQGGGTLSCNVFCGYHMSFQRNSANVYYAIIPDFSQDCATGCGSTALEGLYLTVSHELVEAVTDSDVGAENDLAWYDDANGEIGDICDQEVGSAGGDVVQKMWSNEAQGCRDHRATGGIDTIQVTPAEQTVVAGSNATINLALSGDAGAAALTILGLPTTSFTNAADGGAAEVGFTPSSINPGSTATATLNVAASSRSTDYTASAQATDPGGVVHFAQPVIHVVGAAPTITSFTPGTGPSIGGTAVTITGTNFGLGSTATVGGQPAQGGYVGGTSGTQFALTTPSHAAGNATIVVTNLNDGAHPASSSTPFVYTAGAAPTVTSVVPNAGPTAGGQFLTITGTNFGSNATVTFGGVAVGGQNEGWVDANTIQIITPAHGAGAVNVVVTNADTQAATLTNGYTYGANASPVIDSLSVNQGPTAGGTYVTIYGGSFGSAPTVKFGTVSGTVTTVNNSFVGVVSPPHPAGPVSVVLTNPDNQSVTSTTQFTYVAPAADAGVDSGSGSGSDGGSGGTDAGTTDSGSDDSGATDSGAHDSGSHDSGSTDSSVPRTDSGPTPGDDSGPGTVDSGPTPGQDSGPAPSDDAGASDDGGTAGTTGGGGCGCSVPGEQRGSNPLSILGLGVIVFAADRRRRARRSNRS